jgi:hypothetical protein
MLRAETLLTAAGTPRYVARGAQRPQARPTSGLNRGLMTVARAASPAPLSEVPVAAPPKSDSHAFRDEHRDPPAANGQRGRWPASAGYLPREVFFGRLGFGGAFFTVWASDFGRFLPATSDSFPLDVSRARSGVHEARHGPLRGPTEVASLQGKEAAGVGAAPFGGRNGLVCILLLTDTRSTAATGAWPSWRVGVR